MNLRLKISLVALAAILFITATYVLPDYTSHSSLRKNTASVEDGIDPVSDGTIAGDSDEYVPLDNPGPDGIEETVYSVSDQDTASATTQTTTSVPVDTSSYAPAQPVDSVQSSSINTIQNVYVPSSYALQSAAPQQPTAPSPVRSANPASLATMSVSVVDDQNKKVPDAHIVVRSLDGGLLGEGDTTSSGTALVKTVYKDVARIATIEAIQGRKRTMIPYKHAAVSAGTTITVPKIYLLNSDVALKDPSLGKTVEVVVVPYGHVASTTIEYKNISKNSEPVVVEKSPFVSTSAQCPAGVAALTTDHVVWPTGAWSTGTQAQTKYSIFSITSPLVVPAQTQSILLSVAVDNRVEEILVNDISVWKNTVERVESYNHGCAKVGDALVTLSPSSFKQDGTDTITFIAEDYGTESYFDFQVTALVSAPPTPTDINDSFIDYIKKQISNFFTNLFKK